MKFIKYLSSIALLFLVVLSCKKEKFNDTSLVATDVAPNKLAAMFEITQDNTGLVTITPNGESIAYFEVYYGDATVAPAKVLPGKNTQHTYPEGVYPVKVVAHSITGLVTESTQQLTVSFRAPINVDGTATIDAANIFKVNVTASATYETLFKIYFGDVPNEVPVSLLEGSTVSHVYAAVGTYTIRIVALSGGVATTTITRTITIVNPTLLPIDFESATVDYSFTNFGGGTVTKIANPQIGGINSSATVGKMVKNAPEVWGGSFIPLSNPIDFSANKVFRMKVYSPRVGAKVLLKVENLTNGGISFEKEATTTVANAWEDLVFDYSAINTTESYQKIALIFELGTVGNGSPNFTFLFDDIRLTNQLPTSLLTLPVTFDDVAVNYAVTDFGNNQSVAAADPTNAGNKVKKTTKPSGAETWAGTTMGSGFTTRIPFTASATQMSIKVFSPAAGIKVRLKVEDKTNVNVSVETEATTTVANTWETLVFNFANQATGTAAINFASVYDKASIFFDFGTAGTGKVFYWDDVKFLTSNIVGLALPLDFQSTTLMYTFTDFGGGTGSVINNPDASGINTSTKVGAVNKSNGAQVWAGTYLELASPINFATQTTIKMKVWSPRPNVTVKLKLEKLSDPNINIDRDAVTTVTNGWEELTYNFSGIVNANNYQRVVVFFDFNVAGTGANYYFDDIRLN